MLRFFFGTLLLVFCFSCQPANHPNQEIANDYFAIFSERIDTAKFFSFYAKDFAYENVNFQAKTNSVKELVDLHYAWFDNSTKFANQESIEVESVSTNDSTIVAKGFFLPYTYNGKPINAMNFVIVLELDANKQIKKQTDWFQYSMQEMIEAYQIKQSLKIE